MSNMEICANCAKEISTQEEAHVWNERVVCAPCRGRLEQTPVQKELAAASAGRRGKLVVSGGKFEIEDRSAALPAKPRVPLTQVDGRFDFLPMQKVEVTIDDGEDAQPLVVTAKLPNRITAQGIAHAAETETGKCVLKVVVLERFWEKAEKRAIHAEDMTSQAIWKMFCEAAEA